MTHSILLETSFKPEVVEKKVEKLKDSVDDIKKDYEYTRGNLYSIIEKGQESFEWCS